MKKMIKPVIKWSGSKRSQVNEILKYFPKEIDFKLISDNQVMNVQRKLNKRPRKKLGFNIPGLAFFNQLL